MLWSILQKFVFSYLYRNNQKHLAYIFLKIYYTQLPIPAKMMFTVHYNAIKYRTLHTFVFMFSLFRFLFTFHIEQQLTYTRDLLQKKTRQSEQNQFQISYALFLIHLPSIQIWNYRVKLKKMRILLEQAYHSFLLQIKYLSYVND